MRAVLLIDEASLERSAFPLDSFGYLLDERLALFFFVGLSGDFLFLILIFPHVIIQIFTFALFFLSTASHVH